MPLARVGKAGHIASMRQLSTRAACLICALAAGAALGIALASEYWGGLAPCALCLWERVPYRVAIGLGLLGFVLPARPIPRSWVLLAILLTVLAAAGLAFVHVGVEQGFWPSPLPECATRIVTFGSIAERLAAMPAMPAKPCDEPTFLIPAVPFSMAAMNLLFALGFAACIVVYLSSNRRPKP
jgi:disulfide bond formation protein DsbB